MCNQSSSLILPSLQAPDPLQSLEDQIAELSAQIEAATYRLLCLLQKFDEMQGWQNGFRSCAHWLSWRVGIDLGAARERVRVAKALPGLPKISKALQQGCISYSKVRAMSRVATAANEEDLLVIAQHSTASQVEQVVRNYRQGKVEEENDRANQQHEQRYVKTYYDDRGNLVIEGRLPAEVGARLVAALDVASEVLLEGEDEVGRDEVQGGQLRADALGLIADNALEKERLGTVRSQVVVHVDAQVLAEPKEDGRAELAGGVHVSAETCRRLACDSDVVTMVEGADGKPLAVGRKRRSIPLAISRALDSRDQGCQFPGCNHRLFLEGHHIKHWANGGPTDLENLVNLCSWHHRSTHEGGFRVKRNEKGDLVFYTPLGKPIPVAPELPVVLHDPHSLLSQDHRDLGLSISSASLRTWAGESLDYVWADEILREHECRLMHDIADSS